MFSFVIIRGKSYRFVKCLSRLVLIAVDRVFESRILFYLFEEDKHTMLMNTFGISRKRPFGSDKENVWSSMLGIEAS